MNFLSIDNSHRIPAALWNRKRVLKRSEVVISKLTQRAVLVVVITITNFGDDNETDSIAVGAPLAWSLIDKERFQGMKTGIPELLCDADNRQPFPVSKIVGCYPQREPLVYPDPSTHILDIREFDDNVKRLSAKHFVFCRSLVEEFRLVFLLFMVVIFIVCFGFAFSSTRRSHGSCRNETRTQTTRQ